MTLEPIEPRQAVDLYLADRETEVTQARLYAHSSRLGHLVRWCEEQEITNLNELTGRKLQEYRLWRRRDGDLSKASEKTQMDTVRVFVKWLEAIDAVEPDLHTKVRSHTLTGDDNVRSVMLDHERATEILSYLNKFEYASRRHVALALAFHTMMRVGALRALDVEDYSREEETIQVVHRPNTGTPIKNKEKGERYVALAGEICTLLEDWIDNRRPHFTEESGRQPLITTSRGRVHKGTLRGDIYRVTRPCYISDECPHDRDLDDCEARSYESAS